MGHFDVEAALITGAARWEIATLLHRYAELVDAADFDGVADLLAHATLTAEGTPIKVTGRDEFCDFYTSGSRVYADTGTLKTQHVVTNPIIEVDIVAGTATCRSNLMVLQAVAGELPLQPILTARYHDRFERVDGNWQFTARHGFLDLVGDLSHQHDQDPPGGLP